MNSFYLCVVLSIGLAGLAGMQQLGRAGEVTIAGQAQARVDPPALAARSIGGVGSFLGDLGRLPVDASLRKSVLAGRDALAAQTDSRLTEVLATRGADRDLQLVSEEALKQARQAERLYEEDFSEVANNFSLNPASLSAFMDRHGLEPEGLEKFDDAKFERFRRELAYERTHFENMPVEFEASGRPRLEVIVGSEAKVRVTGSALNVLEPETRQRLAAIFPAYRQLMEEYNVRLLIGRKGDDLSDYHITSSSDGWTLIPPSAKGSRYTLWLGPDRELDEIVPRAHEAEEKIREDMERRRSPGSGAHLAATATGSLRADQIPRTLSGSKEHLDVLKKLFPEKIVEFQIDPTYIMQGTPNAMELRFAQDVDTLSEKIVLYGSETTQLSAAQADLLASAASKLTEEVRNSVYQRGLKAIVVPIMEDAQQPRLKQTGYATEAIVDTSVADPIRAFVERWS